MSRSPARTVRAFAPGHLTGIFRPDLSHRDPRGRGSVGAGIVLELGARAEARFVPGPHTAVRVTGDGPGPWPISTDVARRLAPRGPGVLTVRLAHDLPVGQGFGMSAAGALATALVVSALSGTLRPHAVGVAHLADLYGGGGLGGVAAILGGGLEVRTRAGVPPFGRVVHHPFHLPVLVGVVGRPIPSPSVLRDPKALRRISNAARGWEQLGRGGTAREFFRLSERFTDRAGLSSNRVLRVVRALRHRGAWAAQAMFGESFFARPRTASGRERCVEWLREQGIRTVELRAASGGARVLSGRSG